MNDIDFLPADYVCVQTTRSNNNWLRGLFVAVLGLMALGWGAQQKSIGDLRARRDHLQAQGAALMSSLKSADPLRAELKQAENAIRMTNGLKVRIPTTRWLAAVVEALPAQVSLIEMHAELDEGADAGVRPEFNSAAAKPNPPPQVDPVQLDLDRLAKVTPRRSLTISLRGSASDDLQVSQFLTALHRIDLFDRVQLLFTDQHGHGSVAMRSFAIRVRTRSLGSRGSERTSTTPVATEPGQFRRQ